MAFSYAGSGGRMAFNYLLLPSLIAIAALVGAWFLCRRLFSLRGKRFSAVRKVTEGFGLSLLAIIAFGLAASSALNAAMYAWFRWAPTGVIYRVNGHRMRIDCVGRGSPTLVLESGLASGGLAWDGVQPILARTTQVCSYDRAGNGWSDPTSSRRDADHIADELHDLLADAHVDGPIVLMGHSLGGIYIRDYATRYPGQVAGLIFVDSSIPLQDQKGVLMRFPPRMLTQAALSTGIAHWALRLQDSKAPDRAIDDASYANLQEAFGEMADFDQSSEEALRKPVFGDLPILILSHDPAAEGPEPDPSEVEGMHIFDRLQQDLLALSTRSRRIIAKGSGHVVQFDRPQLLEEEVSLFVERARGAAPPPPRYGTTVTK